MFTEKKHAHKHAYTLHTKHTTQHTHTHTLTNSRPMSTLPHLHRTRTSSQAFALGEKLGIDPKVLAGVVNRCNRRPPLGFSVLIGIQFIHVIPRTDLETLDSELTVTLTPYICCLCDIFGQCSASGGCWVTNVYNPYPGVMEVGVDHADALCQPYAHIRQ